MLDLVASARYKGSDDMLRAQMLVSIGVVRSTSAPGICFVGDTPAKIGVLTLRSSRSSDILSVLFSRDNAMISSSKVVLSRSPFKSSERHSELTVFLLCLLHFVQKLRLRYVCNTTFHRQIFRMLYEISFSLDITTVTLLRLFTSCSHPAIFYRC